MRTSRHLKPFATALLCTLVFGPACLAQGPLDCSALQSSMLWNEASALATAPHGATRSTEHRLDVRWSHGIRSFVDVAPYGIGDAAGIRYDDCGYEARTGMHLVYRYNEDEVNGLLLHDGTGALLPPDTRSPSSLTIAGTWPSFSRVVWTVRSGVSTREMVNCS